MNMVKDLERVGDYAKVLVELEEITVPASDQFASVELIVKFVKALSPAMREAVQVKAVQMIERGKDIRRKLSAAQHKLLNDQENDSRASTDTLTMHY